MTPYAEAPGACVVKVFLFGSQRTRYRSSVSSGCHIFPDLDDGMPEAFADKIDQSQQLTRNIIRSE